MEKGKLLLIKVTLTAILTLNTHVMDKSITCHWC